ncbi:hypothetical protein [Vibrio sp. ED002]|uniref:hypothetical protein n=1 Tax=Vibrio sp. ED002 TaxID=2785123 RepID=UPI00200CCDC9|nr:hypothetical protein [Vibrio sp. ED002]UQA51687.1 hypothetical protein ITG12_04980 [Vibrio sp. ED002]
MKLNKALLLTAAIVATSANAFERSYGIISESVYEGMASTWSVSPDRNEMVNNNNTLDDFIGLTSQKEDEEFAYIDFRNQHGSLVGMIRIAYPDIENCAYDEIVGTVNGQKVNFMCVVNAYGIKNFAPRTEVGSKFFTNEFRKKHKVEVRFPRYHFVFVANGFAENSKKLKDSTAL